MIKIKLHLLMAKERMTQKDVADKTGIAPSVVNKYYHDTIIRIDREHIDSLCKLFNCEVQDLIEYIPDEEKQD